MDALCLPHDAQLMDVAQALVAAAPPCSSCHVPSTQYTIELEQLRPWCDQHAPLHARAHWATHALRMALQTLRLHRGTR